jgi:AcrR family transcriptional regulator
MQAVIDLLTEINDSETITVRQIADRAGVGIGSINYHFQSKENLLNEAVSKMIGDQAARWYEPLNETAGDPVERLKMLLIETANTAYRYEKISRIAISHALLKGGMEPAQLILPILREIHGKKKEESELRLIAFQLITASQVLFLRDSAFHLYSGINIFDELQRKYAIEKLVENLITT